MKISVALCTYNGADFLLDQLESIVAQSRPPNEIVICDDASTDETQTLLKQFSANSPIPISLHFNEKNLGISGNFEQTIGRCTGDIITLSDQDDIWRTDKLELIEESFYRRPEVGLVFSDAEIVDENLNPLGRRMWDEVGFDQHKRNLVRLGRTLEVLIFGWTVTGATMAFRSKFVKLSLPIPRGLAMIHDGWIALTVAAVADIAMIEEPLIKYRQHGRQQIGAPMYAGTPEDQARYVEALEKSFRQRNNGAELQKTLASLEERLATQAALFDTGEALSFVDNYSRQQLEELRSL